MTMETAKGRSAWGYPPQRPFQLLAGFFLIGCLQLSLTAFRPPLPETHVAMNLALAFVALVQAAVTLIAGRMNAAWLLPYIVASGVIIPAFSAWTAAGGQGQLIAGFYLGILGLYSGYFLASSQVRALLVLSTGTFGAALLLNYRLDSLGYLVAVIVVLVVMTLVVSSLVQRLRAEAVHDPLTGALNRRGLSDAAEVVHALDGRRHLATTIVEIDLNGFKQFNDTHGHQAGDELLAAVVRNWSSVLRRTDLLSRTGGDEFVLVLPGTSRAEAENLIARMREVNPVEWAVGLSTWEAGQDLPTAVDVADTEMYLQKANRRTPPPG